MLSVEVASALGPFFDRIGPSHEELTRLFQRAGLADGDPAREQGVTVVGKMRRVRGVLLYALDRAPAAGERLVGDLLGAVRAHGGFHPESEDYPGAASIEALQRAFAGLGFVLDPDGTIRPATLEGLDGRELSAALHAYVRRARLGATDAALLVGTGKDLLEATARHVLVSRLGEYDPRAGLPQTLWFAFDQLGLAAPSSKMIELIDPDPTRAVDEALYLLGCAVNRLRHAEGTGHGRPFPSTVSDAEAGVVVQGMGLVAQRLLDVLEGRSTTPSR